MKSVALERDELCAKQRERLANEAGRRRGVCARNSQIGMRNIVERRRPEGALADEATLQKLKVAGFRGDNPLTRFLFFASNSAICRLRFGCDLPFVLGGLPDRPAFIKLFVCILVAYAGSLCADTLCEQPRRQGEQSIQMAWPDAFTGPDADCVDPACRWKLTDLQGRRRDRCTMVARRKNSSSPMPNSPIARDGKVSYENLAGRTG